MSEESCGSPVFVAFLQLLRFWIVQDGRKSRGETAPRNTLHAAKLPFHQSVPSLSQKNLKRQLRSKSKEVKYSNILYSSECIQQSNNPNKKNIMTFKTGSKDAAEIAAASKAQEHLMEGIEYPGLNGKLMYIVYGCMYMYGCTVYSVCVHVSNHIYTLSIPT
jgi:hypothetical protein